MPTIDYKQKYLKLRRNLLIAALIVFFIILWLFDHYNVLDDIVKDVSGRKLDTNKTFLANMVSIVKWCWPVIPGAIWLYHKIWPDTGKLKLPRLRRRKD